MRTLLPKILLAFLLLAVAGAYANAGKHVSVPHATSHTKIDAVYAHSSINSNQELALSVTHAVNSSSHQVSLRKFTGFGSIEHAQATAFHQNKSFSFSTVTLDNRSAHLLLIFPFHYFW